MTVVTKRVLLVASIGDDALAMMRLTQQLYGLMQPMVHIDVLAVGATEETLAQAIAVSALASGRYESACCATAQGVFYPVNDMALLPAITQAAEARLQEVKPWVRTRAGNGEYCTLIARPERLVELVHEAGRRLPEARIDSAALRAQKNEWIEAGYIAAQLASGAGRRLLLLSGKNYRLEEDTELFYAPLKNGSVVESSDLRALYFVRADIDFARANFTEAQLREVARLPAELTPVYVDGAGRLTLNEGYEALVSKMGGGDSLRVRCGTLSHVAWQVPQEGLTLLHGELARLSLPHGSAWELLGQPQPGDTVLLTRPCPAVALQQDALEAA